ncbi:hypothetical protein BDF21DRAFT_418430 [Thamnidium elegans]|uniref:Uncharacterized protein n=1 Tax=Thamnidium elegans TaxID=101142 RepID=A0A8H7SMU1_9FUNG|nr:hypothetical protein INT48_008865 [Thamnidium elegans]KAI8081120.1 hypothetical protein BDF21DRAFT_418430 [Thamnidium elegans]
MDLSWCIICDRHSIEENLYCSETCRTQDVNHKHAIVSDKTMTLRSPPASPLLDPFFSSFNHERRTSITISKSTRTTPDIFGYMSPSSVPRYSLSD